MPGLEAVVAQCSLRGLPCACPAVATAPVAFPRFSAALAGYSLQRCPAPAASPARGALVAGGEQAQRDKLVQMVGRQPAADAGRGCRLLPGDRPGAAGHELIELAADRVIEAAERRKAPCRRETRPFLLHRRILSLTNFS